MSFNLKKIGRPFAKIDSGKDKDKIVSIDDNETDEGFNKMKLKDGKFEQIPSTSQERDIFIYHWTIWFW